MKFPVLALVFDRHHRATTTRTGSVELRITHASKQRYIATGIRLLPRHWRNGTIINRIDAMEVQRSLDLIMSNARRVINELVQQGTFDIDTIGQYLTPADSRARSAASSSPLLMDYFSQRAEIRKYGRTTDSQQRYDRFLRWFQCWDGMATFEDITEGNILLMDKALGPLMKDNSKWNNYHRFLNSFIRDAMREGYMRRNPYESLHINKDKISNGLSKYLTREEFAQIEAIELPTNYLRHARDLFVFQCYTCLSYTDLRAFDSRNIKDINGKPVYTGHRGKTHQEYTFLLLRPALRILDAYDGKLPVMTNQQYNKAIKEVARLAGLNKPVTTHWARHTGATLLLNSGVGMEIVAKVLGHSSTKITREVYAKLLDETVADAMARVESQITPEPAA